MNTLTKNPALVMVRIASLILLSVIGITALLGGAALVIDPSGQSMSLNVEGLAGTIFDDFLVPGIILFLAIGVLSLSVAVLTVANAKNYPILIFYQGVILTGWIMTQIYLLPETHYMQIVYGLFGIMLMLLGSYLLVKKNHVKALY